MTRLIRKSAQMRAVTIATAAWKMYQAAQHVDAAFRLCDGKVLVPELRKLILEERHLQGMAMAFEGDWLRAAMAETGDRLPPLLGSIEEALRTRLRASGGAN